jgi:hypothetical protein
VSPSPRLLAVAGPLLVAGVLALRLGPLGDTPATPDREPAVRGRLDPDLRDAVRRWVATPDTSAHVTGDAVDIGPPNAAAWLDEHGSSYGLCRVFANETWHFELATEPGGACPEMLPDGSYR